MINKRIVVAMLLQGETVEEAHRSISSVIKWRTHSAQHGSQVNIVCVCSDPEFTACEELQLSFPNELIDFRKKTFDMSKPVPDARELFDEAEASIGFKDLVLILAPGHVLWDFNGLTKCTNDLVEDPRSIFIVAGRKLPVATLFVAETQRTCGLLLFAQEGWPIEAQWSLFGKRYARVGDPLACKLAEDKRLYGASWLIGAIACFVQERMKRELWLRPQEWAE